MIMFMIMADGPTSNEHDGWHGMVNIHDYDMPKVMITKVMTKMIMIIILLSRSSSVRFFMERENNYFTVFDYFDSKSDDKKVMIKK